MASGGGGGAGGFSSIDAEISSTSNTKYASDNISHSKEGKTKYSKII